jgi:hypothetical protein
MTEARTFAEALLSSTREGVESSRPELSGPHRLFKDERKAKSMAISTARLARAAVPAAVLAGTAALALSSVPAQAGVSTHHAGDPSVVFTFTGDEQSWAVPSGVTSVTISAIGAAGGSTDAGVNTGGQGASVFSTVRVFPGQILYVDVGGVGGNGRTTGPQSPGGFNGGGRGGYTGAGGGGASDVRTIATRSMGSLDSRLVVAAGGGGAGSDGTCGSSNGGGGNGGPQATAGADGGGCPATPVSATGGSGGQPGGSAAGGAHGAAGTPTVSTIDATDGVQGTGGEGGTRNSGANEADGGGGGGGAYGGGGGGCGGFEGVIGPNAAGAGGGGGGGSSVGASLGPTTAAASVTISYGAPGALTITTSSPLPKGSVQTHYSTTLAASGGSGGNTWSVTSGSLPAGLSLSSAGVISGTPATGGTKTFTSQVRDSVGATASKRFSLTIGPHSDLAISLTHLGTFRHGKTGQYQILVTNTGSGATSRTTSVTLSLPSGLKMVFGGSGTWWQCHKDTGFSVCARSGKINAHASTTITARVKISAPAGSFRTATATVSPADSTPGNNTDKDVVKIHRK